MPLATGTYFGPYQIVSPLGAGGMGEVYRARDSKLGREVALKVLAADHAQDREYMSRFEREAQVLASINHPNIASVYGLQDGAIAMELVEGPTLAERIVHGPLPIAEALDIARQIAVALEYAHERGIVHRDLKPANVKITDEGVVKVLDFGLAKIAETQQAGKPENSPTLTFRSTQVGVLLGTAAYMAPEQARGEAVDRRADIWAFGAVVYEMLTGRMAFPGDTTTDILASVLKVDPDWTALPPETPPAIAALLRRCLHKDRKQRLRDIGEARILLEHPAEWAAPAPAKNSRRWIWAALAASVVAGGAGFWAGRELRPAVAQAPKLKFTRITHDAGLTFEPTISPDGKFVVYASDRAGKGDLDLWMQQVGGSGMPVRLTSGPADEHEPAFSPAGNQIAFRSEEGGGAIYTMAALGGEPRLLVRGGRGPQWSPDGSQIAYWSGGRLMGVAGSKVFVMSANGGEQVDVSAADGRNRHPVWAPDGRHVLMHNTDPVGRRAGSIWVVEARPAGAKRKWEGLPPLYRPAAMWKGMLLVATNSGLKAVPLSQSTWLPAGELIDVTPGLLAGEATPSVSSSGVLVFAGQNLRSNVWMLPVDAARGRTTGEPRRITRDAGYHLVPVLAPDGKTVLYSAQGGLVTTAIEGEKSKYVVPPPAGIGYPSYSADGKRIAYARAVPVSDERRFVFSIYTAEVEGGPPQRVCENCGLAPTWSPDGRKLVWDTGTPRHLGVLDLESRQSRRLTALGERGIFQPSFSPDGKWILAEMEHGADYANLIIAPYREGGEIQTSEWIPLTEASGFNSRPRWSPDGNRIYFASDRDGFRCIWTLPLDESTRRASGAVTPVLHFHEAQRSIPNLGGIAPFSLSVGRDKMVFNVGELNGNIWLAE